MSIYRRGNRGVYASKSTRTDVSHRDRSSPTHVHDYNICRRFVSSFLIIQASNPTTEAIKRSIFCLKNIKCHVRIFRAGCAVDLTLARPSPGHRTLIDRRRSQLEVPPSSCFEFRQRLPSLLHLIALSKKTKTVLCTLMQRTAPRFVLNGH